MIQALDPKIVNELISNPEFPFLVSPMHSGMRWFCAVLEAYLQNAFGQWSYWYHESKKCYVYHTHDFNLDLDRKRVIFLYRNKRDTIFGAMKHFGDDVFDEKIVKVMSDKYDKYMEKYLNYEDKLVLKFELVQANPIGNFGLVLDYLGLPKIPDCAKFNEYIKLIDRDVVLGKVHPFVYGDKYTQHLTKEYYKERELFGERFIR